MNPDESDSQSWFDLMTSGAVVQNEKGAIVRFNQAALSILGLSEDELSGRTSWDPRWHSVQEDLSPFPGDQHPAVVVLRTRQPVLNVLMGVFHPADSEYRWIRVSAHPYGSNSVFTTFDDVTPWKAANDRLSLEQHLFTSGPVVVLQRRGSPSRLTYLSSNFQTALGLDPRPFLDGQEDLWSRIHEQDRARLDSDWSRVLEDSRLDSFSGRFRLQDGAGLWREIGFQTILDRGGPGREASSLAYWLDRTEEARTEQRLELTLEAAQTGTWDWSVKPGQVRVDGQWKRLLGIDQDTSSTFSLQAWESLFHTEDLPRWRGEEAALLAGTQASLDIELRQRSTLGPWSWFRIRGRVLEVDPDGAPSRILGTLEDITDLLRTRDELTALSQVVEQGPGAVILTDVGGRVEYVNKQFSRMSGYSFEQIQGQNPRLLKSPKTDPAVHQDLWSTISAGQPWLGEFQNQRADGSTYWVQSLVSPIADSSGKVHRFAAQQIDISARKRAEEAFRAQFEFQLFLNRASARLVSVRGENVRVVLSEILMDLCGHFRAERAFIGFLHAGKQSLKIRAGWNLSEELLSQNDELALESPWADRLKGRMSHLFSGLSGPVPWSDCPVEAVLSVPLEGGYGDPGCLVLEAGQGREGWTTEELVSATVVANSLSAFVKRLVDEATVQASRVAAEKANQAKSDFLAHISHEIRTPMNGILGLAGLLSDQPLSEEARTQVAGIQASGESLLALVNDLLDVSKIEAGKMELELLPLSLNRLVTETLEPLKVLAKQKGLAFQEVWTQPESDHRLGDPTRLRQILTNLVGNALKFTKAGSITVQVDCGDVVRFSVRDTGPGVPPERRERLFLRYSQTDKSTARQFGGTGLGLAICRELVLLMDGEIGYRDVEGTPGAEFWFSVPLAPVLEQAAAAASVVEPTPLVSGNWRVLVVEDNPVNQTVAKGLLKKFSVVPTVVSQGLEALDALVEGNFDLVLMDVQMPVMDGLTCCRAVRRGEGGEQHRKVPIIAMTANAMGGDREACLEAGMNDYISKPLSAAQFSSMLEKWARPVQNTVFDPVALKDRLQLDDELVREIVELFHQDLPSRKQAFLAAEDSNDGGLLRRLAHTLKGTSANLVADSVVAAAQALESGGFGEGADESRRRAVMKVVGELDKLDEALAAFLVANGSPPQD